MFFKNDTFFVFVFIFIFKFFSIKITLCQYNIFMINKYFATKYYIFYFYVLFILHSMYRIQILFKISSQTNSFYKKTGELFIVIANAFIVSEEFYMLII
ncbi:hypothetical protein RFI_00045 [Reticulomyxa filosa]|uniref:Uncharacterized protein n=1 Tax=Reticulomyxa filosa TaxID=46433 RepID=X6PH48_RETFI|nr:hypothetical protein RFI_00045 [Reticulomyxa filosa]|eukprot:ETO37017.1 hypothetical protein RFI_00045 [Reticulomyxa filosa]